MTIHSQVKQTFKMAGTYIISSESVSEGHPDKICDRISDAVLDAYLEINQKHADLLKTRVACETAATTNNVVLLGEFRSPAGDIDAKSIVRRVVKEIGYEQEGFHHENLEVTNLLHGQSVEIAQGVDSGTGLHQEEGAGDQGIMFGYATNQTEALMPAPIYYAHKILKDLADARHGGDHRLQPDAKSQLSVQCVDGKPVGVTSIVLSTQTTEDIESADVRKIVEPYIQNALPDGWITNDTVWHVNPTGKFVIGGPDGDAGLTGRKIIVDTYGGACPHGGGAFSGKDFTKVDRSAAYMARYVAKNIVAAGLAETCEIQLAYAIGVAEPQSIYVETFGTGKVSNQELEMAVRDVFDLTPKGIRETLTMTKPLFERTASYGHFGRQPDTDGGFSWEKTDKTSDLQAAAKFTP